MAHSCELYLLTPPQIDDLPAFASAFEAASAHELVTAVQIRLKGPDDPETGEPTRPNETDVRNVCAALFPIAKAHGVTTIINDDPQLAKAVKADGVHVGQSDASAADARAMVGEKGIVGVTCHASRHLAMEAGEAGADYVAFGAFFPTPTKTPSATADVEILGWWSELFTLPCVAIGGITPDNIAPIARSGADYAAVSSSVWRHPKGPAAAIDAFAQALARSSVSA